MSYITRRVPKKKEQAPDEVLTTTQKVAEWASKNMNAIVYVGGAVLFVLLVVFGILWMRDSREKASAQALAAAVEKYGEGDTLQEPVLESVASSPDISPETPGASRGPELEASLEGFRKVFKDHPRSRQGRLALLYEASVLYRLGRYQESIEAAEKLVQLDPELADGLNVRYLLARAYESNGGLAEAVGIYSQIMDRADGEFKAIVMMDLARCLELTGDAQKSISLLQEVLKEHPKTVLALKAEKKLTLMGLSGGETL